MNFIVNSIKNFNKDEMTKFFNNTVLNTNAVLNDDALREFKRLIIKYPDIKVEERFFQILDKYEGRNQAQILIYFFMYINWCSLNDITAIHQVVRANNFLKIKDKPFFKDDEDSHVFYFNRTFAQYIIDYMKDIRNIYTLKNGNINPKKYAELIVDNKIGYEGLYFYMRRFKLSFALFENFNWFLTERKEHTGFRYVAEVVSRQMIEEFLFVKGVFKELVTHYDQIRNSKQHLNFLLFYELLLWKNKTMNTLQEKFGWFFRENMIKFPNLLSIDDLQEEKFNKDLIVNQKEKDDLKYEFQTNKSYEQLSELATQYFGHLSELASKSDKNIPMFSNRTILHKLNFESNRAVEKESLDKITEED